MGKEAKTRGIVLYTQNHREKDKLVKIFTEDFGKKMFFVRNFGKSRFAAALQPFVQVSLSGTINDDGLSFLQDVSGDVLPRAIHEDIDKQAHAAYLVQLADAALPDGEADKPMFDYLYKTLEMINQGVDEVVLTQIFEVKMLQRFGVAIDFSKCQICHRTDLPMDFSPRYSACLCSEHVASDPHRLHLAPNVIYLCNIFQQVRLADVGQINLSDDIKAQIRQFLAYLYDDFVGLRLPAKKFLDSMGTWYQ
jgi:DNA repair protein RecO (recombination protein O)